MKSAISRKLLSAIAATAIVTSMNVGAEEAGNRYFADRQYLSEISSSETYLLMMQN